MRCAAIALPLAVSSLLAQPAPPPAAAPREADYIAHNFRFDDGQTLAELRLHYRTLGRPVRDAAGSITNAVLILHGTGGSGTQFLSEQFAGVLFGPGQPLDVRKFFIVLPDDIGHGGSSKPSNGMRTRFPHYGYSDMVRAEHDLVANQLHIRRLRLIMGTSMGCMHAFLWGERYPDQVQAMMPLACLPVPIGGRNRLWRRAAIDAIEDDPSWQSGDYASQPAGLRAALSILTIAVSAPLYLQSTEPAATTVDRRLEDSLDTRMRSSDANDLLYQLDSSRDYDPSADLEKIQASVLHVNSADDFVNPPELGIAEREIRRIKHGRFVLLPISPETRGHGTHTRAIVWKQYLEQLLDESGG